MLRRDNFAERCSKAAALYFQVQKLNKLSRYYQYSFDWFIKLFQLDPNSFAENLSKELTKGLPNEFKVAAPLLIAESENAKIPFSNLFNPDIERSKYVLERYDKLNVSKARLQKIISNIQKSNILGLAQMAQDNP